MKILIYGAGVIGSTYGWQLAESGHDVSVLVRKGKKQPIEEKGINIHCTDFRNGTGTIKEAVFRPLHVLFLSSLCNNSVWQHWLGIYGHRHCSYHTLYRL